MIITLNPHLIGMLIGLAAAGAVIWLCERKCR